MNTQNQPQDTLHDIKQMMERSSRFISLSGFSGIAAGSCALIGAWFGYQILSGNNLASNEINYTSPNAGYFPHGVPEQLLVIALLIFASAFVLAFLFTYLRSKKTNTPIWGKTSKRLMFNVSIPMIAGGLVILRLLQFGMIGMIAPCCLIFYGLALINASKYTLIEIRYLGFCQLILGLISLWFIGKGLYFWAMGFGVLHILYGAIMWWKYERN
jgi:hypothetical protein